MDLKPYPKYKDSAIEWLGKVPEGWSLKRLKYVCNQYAEYGLNIAAENYQSEGIRFIRTTDIDDYGNLKGEGVHLDESLIKQYILNNGDLLISRSGTIGRTFLFDSNNNEKATYAGYLVRFSLNKKETFPKYIFYFTQSHSFFEWLRTQLIETTIGNVNGQKYANLLVTLPPIDNQIQIANFLDHKTAKIDELLKKNERLIELLREKRQAIISQAVTKGIPLHPPLEKGGWGDLKIKDSGIKWLGEIPEGWKMVPMKYVTYMKGRIGWQGLKQSEFTEEGPYLITGMNFKGGIIRWEEVYHITEERYNEAPEIHLKIGDVLMTKDGTIGKLLFVDVLPGKASLNSHLLVLRPLKDHFLPKYLYYLLNSKYFKDHIEIYKTGTTFFGITQEAVGFFEMLLPPIEEQQAIIEFTNLENTKIDQAISKILKQIDLLKEYRQTLISNVVTGKVRVT